jgi:hypothetical protein
MTITELYEQYQKIKKERSIYARSPNQSMALKLSSEMVDLASRIYELDNSPIYYKNLQYAKYYQAVSGGVLAELAGNFSLAHEYATQLRQAAITFRESEQFFPNYFFDERDIITRQEVLFAVQAFSEGDFRSSAAFLEKWLSLNDHRKGKGDTKYDCHEFQHRLTTLLASLQEHKECRDQWQRLENDLQSPTLNLYRTTRALWGYVEPLKQAAIRGIENSFGGTDAIHKLLEQIQSQWQLLCISAPLYGHDRIVGLQEPVRMASFLDVATYLTQSGDQWRFLLRVIFRNALLLKADYESLMANRLRSPELDPRPKTSYQIERLTDDELYQYTHDMIKARSKQSTSPDLRIFVESRPLWLNARKLIYKGERRDAVAACDQYFSKLRSRPHVLRVISCKPIDKYLHGTYKSRPIQYEVNLERIWRQDPTQLRMDLSMDIPEGKYLYLRPRWNRSFKEHYRVRNPLDVPLIARMPEWMITFEKWATGRGHATSEVFLQWCEQFDPRRLALALRLLSKIEFFDEDRIRSLWLNLYRYKLPATLKGERVLYAGLGNAGKSGQMQLMMLRQAIDGLPSSERAFDIDSAFIAEDALNHEQYYNWVDSVVFVDDLVGTGEQAASFLDRILRRYPWLNTRSISVYLCALAGYERAIPDLQSRLGKRIRVFVGMTLKDEDKAFSPGNSLWDTEADRNDARDWCLQISRQIGVPERDALGYRGSESLIAFSSNTPDNTLPLFWASEKNGQRPWKPLLPRF